MALPHAAALSWAVAADDFHGVADRQFVVGVEVRQARASSTSWHFRRDGSALVEFERRIAPTEGINEVGEFGERTLNRVSYKYGGLSGSA